MGSKALSGVRILDMTHVQAGPTSSQLLAWMGADVIKFENPTGDITRKQLRHDPNKDSLYFTMLNSNKRSVISNMKSKAGCEIFEALLKKCDVIMENFGPGVLARFGYTWEKIHEINPSIIYATIKGFGSSGPYSDYKASGGKLSLGDWRRDNVDQLVREVYSTIKSIDSSVRFGISPQGNTSINYSEQYIDVEEWLSNPGYVDYICPQVYYGFENDTCPFAATVAEWNSLIRRNDIDLYIGISVSKIGLVDQWAGSGKNEWVENDDMLVRMVSEARKSSHYSGFCMYSYRSLYAPAAAVADQVEQEKEALSELM